MNLIAAYKMVMDLAAPYGGTTRLDPKTRRALVELPATLPRNVADTLSSEFINAAHGYGVALFDKFQTFNDFHTILIDLSENA